VERRRRNLRNEVLSLVASRMRAKVEEQLREDSRFAELLDLVVARKLDPSSAATEILDRLT
jgi:LAO/AO transport system kinase